MLKDAAEHEAMTDAVALERELRDKQLEAAAGQLEAALLKRMEYPSTWDIIHRPTRRRFRAEFDGEHPVALQHLEPYPREFTEPDGSKVIATCFARYVRTVDVSGERPVYYWVRRDKRLREEGAGAPEFKDLPEQSVTPQELHDLADIMEDVVVGSVVSH